MDTTEARYGEMARLMVETNNWLTPQFDYDVPFWGKPPLQTWMSASSILLFENNEFFLRLPHFIAGLFTLIAVALFAKKTGLSVIRSVMVLTTTAVFYVCLGTVMTDMGLLLGTSLAYIGFYLAWQGNKSWAYWGFIGLGIGLLAKGPVALVLFGIGAGLWLVLSYGLLGLWRPLWQRIPLVFGVMTMLLLACPWYYAAEQATPGFLQYFIVGEHWSRFVDSGWQGDLYGSAHDEPRGKIWLFFIGASLPWSTLLPLALYRSYKRDSGWSPLTKFLICWMLAPLILFTFAGNILPAYVLPSAPALALLIVNGFSDKPLKKLLSLGLITPVLLLIALGVVNSGIDKDKSEKWLLSERADSTATYYWQHQPFSGRYYSQGKAEKVQSLNELTSYVTQQQSSEFYLVAANELAQQSWKPYSCEFKASNRKRSLLHCSLQPRDSE